MGPPRIVSKSSEVFYTGSETFFETITQAKVSDASGVLCFADALNDQNSNNFAACASFQIADSALSFSSTEVVNNGTLADVPWPLSQTRAVGTAPSCAMRTWVWGS